jgi:hypothetical protein
MPSLEKDLKDKPNGASAGLLRAVWTHPRYHQQHLRNSFCCGAAVLAYCSETGM